MSMSWINDVSESENVLDTISKQQQYLPTSHVFSKFPNNEVLRVFQLDALTTHDEIVDILRSSLYNIFNIGPLEGLRFSLQEELSLFLDVLLYRLSTWRFGQSVGDRLMNLVLRDERKASELGMTSVTSISPLLAPKKSVLLVHFTFTVLFPYLFRKLRRRSMEESWETDEQSKTRRRAALGMKYATVVWACLSLINTLHFFATGRYRTLVERLLCLKLVYGSQQMVRFTNLVYLNQHVWWTTWISLLSVLKVGRYLKRVMSTLRTITTSDMSKRSLNSNLCCACGEVPTIPQKSNCGHIYCYYCIKSRLMDCEASGSFRCSRCAQAVHSCSPN